jgi:hypothetical protein
MDQEKIYNDYLGNMFWINFYHADERGRSGR